MDLLWICANNTACLPVNRRWGRPFSKSIQPWCFFLKTYHTSLLTICLLKKMWHHDSFYWSIFGVSNSEGKPENWNGFFQLWLNETAMCLWTVASALNLYLQACIAGRGEFVLCCVWAVLQVGLWVRALQSSLCVPGRQTKQKQRRVREDETTGVSGHTFCQSLRLASLAALSNLLLINNKKTA